MLLQPHTKTSLVIFQVLNPCVSVHFTWINSATFKGSLGPENHIVEVDPHPESESWDFGTKI